MISLRPLTGALGYKVFEPLVASKVQSASEGQQTQQSGSVAGDTGELEFHISGARGADARAVVTAEGIVVLEGSFAALDEVESTPDSTRRLRAKLVQEGALVPHDSRFRFVRDVDLDTIVPYAIESDDFNVVEEWTSVGDQAGGNILLFLNTL